MCKREIILEFYMYGRAYINVVLQKKLYFPPFLISILSLWPIDFGKIMTKNVQAKKQKHLWKKMTLIGLKLQQSLLILILLRWYGQQWNSTLQKSPPKTSNDRNASSKMSSSKKVSIANSGHGDNNAPHTIPYIVPVMRAKMHKRSFSVSKSDSKHKNWKNHNPGHNCIRSFFELSFYCKTGAPSTVARSANDVWMVRVPKRIVYEHTPC